MTTVAGIYSVDGLIAFVGMLDGTLGPANGILLADYFFLRGSGCNRLDAGELSRVGGYTGLITVGTLSP